MSPSASKGVLSAKALLSDVGRSHGLNPAWSRIIEYPTKSQSVFEVIREWILKSHLKPGQRLDQEWLAATLNVSRMPLRQALSRLESEGLIIGRAHHSAIVAPLSLNLLEDIYASRRALEGMLAEVGTGRISHDTIDTMNCIVREQVAEVEQNRIENYVQLDRLFHSHLYRASGYDQSCALIERLRDMSDRYIAFYARDSRDAHKSILDHRRILELVERRESAQVRQHTEQHILDGYSALIGVVRKHEANSAEA